MFADDTKCAISINHSSAANPLQSDLLSLSTWSSTWDLLFNESKFVYICVSGLQVLIVPVVTISMAKPLSNHPIIKILGVILTSNLNWSTHHNLIIGQSCKTLGLLRRTFIHSTCVSRKKLYLPHTLTTDILQSSLETLPN